MAVGGRGRCPGPAWAAHQQLSEWQPTDCLRFLRTGYRWEDECQPKCLQRQGPHRDERRHLLRLVRRHVRVRVRQLCVSSGLTLRRVSPLKTQSCRDANFVVIGGDRVVMTPPVPPVTTTLSLSQLSVYTEVVSVASWKRRVDIRSGNFIVFGDTGDCRYDNLRCHHWRQRYHNDKSLFLSALWNMRTAFIGFVLLCLYHEFWDDICDLFTLFSNSNSNSFLCVVALATRKSNDWLGTNDVILKQLSKIDHCQTTTKQHKRWSVIKIYCRNDYR